MLSRLIEKLVSSVAGDDSIPLVKAIFNTQLTEEELSVITKEDIKSVRTKLYKLEESNLVDFTRTIVNGFYVYSWQFNLKHAKYLALHGKDKIKRKETRYECPNKCTSLEFEEAANYLFKCPECGTILKDKVLEKIKPEHKTYTKI